MGLTVSWVGFTHDSLLVVSPLERGWRKAVNVSFIGQEPIKLALALARSCALARCCVPQLRRKYEFKKLDEKIGGLMLDS